MGKKEFDGLCKGRCVMNNDLAPTLLLLDGQFSKWGVGYGRMDIDHGDGGERQGMPQTFLLLVPQNTLVCVCVRVHACVCGNGSHFRPVDGVEEAS